MTVQHPADNDSGRVDLRKRYWEMTIALHYRTTEAEMTALFDDVADVVYSGHEDRTWDPMLFAVRKDWDAE